jgi:glucose-6-phosphate isomerase
LTTSDHPESSENRILIVDLSRQSLTLETLNHLLKLSTARNLRKFIKRLSYGQNDPQNPILPARIVSKHLHGGGGTRSTDDIRNKKATRFEEADEGGRRRHATDATTEQSVPSMHLALRVPADKGHEMLTADGTNALTAIHRDWDRLERLSDSIRRGQLRGISGSMIRDVVVIGQGVPVQALKFVYTALQKDERAVLASRFGMVEAPTARIRRNLMGEAGPVNGGAARRLKFLSTIDPITAADVVSDLDPASTLIISIALRGNEETGLATKTLKSWLLHALGTNRRPGTLTNFQ